MWQAGHSASPVKQLNGLIYVVCRWLEDFFNIHRLPGLNQLRYEGEEHGMLSANLTCSFTATNMSCTH